MMYLLKQKLPIVFVSFLLVSFGDLWAREHFLDEWIVRNPQFREIGNALRTAAIAQNEPEFKIALRAAIDAGARDCLFEVLRRGGSWSVSRTATELSRFPKDKEVATALLMSFDGLCLIPFGGTESRISQGKTRSFVFEALAQVTGVRPDAASTEAEQFQAFQAAVDRMSGPAEVSTLARPIVPAPAPAKLPVPSPVSRSRVQEKAVDAELEHITWTPFIIVSCLALLTSLLWKRWRRGPAP
jgi:hypothetical protein